jgi:hypothetical protein
MDIFLLPEDFSSLLMRRNPSRGNGAYHKGSTALSHPMATFSTG